MLEAGQTNFATVLSELTKMVRVKRYLGIIIIRLGVETIIIASQHLFLFTVYVIKSISHKAFNLLFKYLNI